jgi:hypothetical protein
MRGFTCEALPTGVSAVWPGSPRPTQTCRPHKGSSHNCLSESVRERQKIIYTRLVSLIN